MRTRMKKVLAGVSALAALALGGAAISQAGTSTSPHKSPERGAQHEQDSHKAGKHDAGERATGAGADQARAAALKAFPGGRANAVERDSENGATWEVEIKKSDGQTVDVRLDQNYKVLVAESDSEHGNH